MKLSRIAAAFVVLVLAGSIAPPLSAEESAAPAAPVAAAAPEEPLPLVFLTEAPAALPRCPNFWCPVYPEYGCSCDLITCPDGTIHCGRWDGTSALSAPAGPLTRAPQL